MRVWRKLNLRDIGDLEIARRRMADKSKGAKLVALLLREFGGHELYLDEHYVRKEGDVIEFQADECYVLLER